MVIFHSYVSLPEGKFYLKDSSANSAGSLRNVVRNVVNTISLVGGLEHLDFIFSRIYGIIIPTDFHIFQDGYCTTNQSCCSTDCDLLGPYWAYGPGHLETMRTISVCLLSIVSFTSQILRLVQVPRKL